MEQLKSGVYTYNRRGSQIWAYHGQPFRNRVR